jgi:putative endonuclease
LINKYVFGSIAEYLVMLRYLLCGYKFLYHRWKLHKIGEIDLIFFRKKIIVFIEVKARSSEDFLFVTQKQQKSIIKTIKFFLYKNSAYQNCEARIDFAYVNKFFWLKICKNVFLQE